MDYTELLEIFLYNTTTENLELQASGQLCGPWLTRFGALNGEVHGFVALFVCFFGCILNLLNLIILTRPEMQNSTNVILSGLAFADFLSQVGYMPFALFMKILARPGYPPKTYLWAAFVLVHSNVSQVCHTTSIWLTVTLAVWRYWIVVKSVKSKTFCTMGRAKLAVGLAYVGSIIVCIPDHLTFSIRKTVRLSRTGIEVLHFVHYSELAEAHNQLLVKANFWIYSVVIKLIPCAVLTFVSIRLITSLIDARKRKSQLKGCSWQGPRMVEEKRLSNRTTRMLLAVLFLFLITEFPQGILGLLSSVLGDSFFRNCYLPLGDLMDIIALVNSAINFILFTFMSFTFRQTFAKTLYLERICSKI